MLEILSIFSKGKISPSDVNKLSIWIVCAFIGNDKKQLKAKISMTKILLSVAIVFIINGL